MKSAEALSTYDGISIAWSIVEYLHSASQKTKNIICHTLS